MTLIEDLKENYSKFDAKYFAEKYNKSVEHVYYIVLKFKIKKIECISDELESKIINSYCKDQINIEKIHKKYSISRDAISKLLKKQNIEVRKDSNKKYSWDETFFEAIDTPEKAYWFGFIAADGGINKNGLQIGLAKKDKEHLLKFCKRIGYSGPLVHCKSNDSFKLCITRTKIYNDLIRLGMEENKTFKINENIFNCVPEYLIPAAMHGYFDGDGTFGKSGKHLQFAILGNERFLIYFKDKISEFGIDMNGPKKDDRTKQTFYCWKGILLDVAKSLKKLFYENEFSSKDFLDRKKNKLYSQTFQVGKTFKLVHDNGEIVEIENQRQFSRERGLNYKEICKVINKKAKSHKGWRAIE